MLKPFALRASSRRPPSAGAAWRFIEPMLFGQVYTNKRAISSHYNADPKMFLSFLDPVFPAYSQGVYAHDDEPLAKALERKFDWAHREMRARARESACSRSARAGAPSPATRYRPACASPASPIREVSQSYLKGKLANFGDRFDILLTDFYDFEPKREVRRHRHHGRDRASARLRARAEEVLSAAQAGRPRVPRRQRCARRNTSCRPSWCGTSIPATTPSSCSTISSTSSPRPTSS